MKKKAFVMNSLEHFNGAALMMPVGDSTPYLSPTESDIPTEINGFNKQFSINSDDVSWFIRCFWPLKCMTKESSNQCSYFPEFG